MKKRVMLAFLTLLLLSALFVIWGLWQFNHASCDPRGLRRPWTHYAVDLPAALQHCSVPSGTSETTLIRRFGNPDDVLHTGTEAWAKHTKGRSATGWTLPETERDAKVLIYNVNSKLLGVVVYHFIDDAGKLQDTFIGET